MLVLKTLVIGFAVLLLVAAVTLIAFGANRLGGTGFDLTKLEVPAGCRVEQMTAEGDRLILSIGGRDDCRQVLIADMKSGQMIGQFDLTSPQ
ncbi:MAG: hypothetical protein IPK59_01080 [Rhodospirillaceae bacterium]|nr:hypothetical protein [Rhodospirillaceae bacterium]